MTSVLLSDLPQGFEYLKPHDMYPDEIRVGVDIDFPDKEQLYDNFIGVVDSGPPGVAVRFDWVRDSEVLDGIDPISGEAVPDTWVITTRDKDDPDDILWVSDLSNHKDRGPDTAWHWFCCYMSGISEDLREWDDS